MKPERWQQIDQLLEAALERSPDERAAFLADACAADTTLRVEVESLLRSHEEAGNFIEAPAIEMAAEMLADAEAESMSGKRLSSYKILQRLGVGGMGEVYLAQDTRLGRQVALKLLPARFTNDEDRVRRFEREARAVSAINHPNIITIYETGRADDIYYIATEFIEGSTLRKQMAETRLKLSEALDATIQIASALAASHAAGIIHRDIKPENIILRPDGYVKVLDFGLVKLAERQVTRANSRASLSDSFDTHPGMILGTVQYMSPEQTRGLEVDARSDIFSLGVVLYEMITGRQPFVGATTSDIIASILRSEPPPLAQYSPDAPNEIEQIIVKALAKAQEERYQTVKDLTLDLKSLAREMELRSLLSRGRRPSPKSAKEDITRQMPQSGQGSEDQKSASVTAQLICPGCKSINPGVARFCLNCGGSLVTDCANCQTKMPPGARFCFSCGQQVGGVTPVDNVRQSRLAAATPSSLANKIREAGRPAGGMAHERRVVTALLADLSILDASARQIDPEDWSEVLNRALDRLSTVIYHYEGAIARLMGNTILAFFGAPLAHEDDPARAVRSALDMLDDVRAFDSELRCERGFELDIRIGINTGTVILGNVSSDLKIEFTVMGDTVNLAALMQSAARPMSLLLAENTWQQVAPIFNGAEFASLDVKGKADPVRAFEVLGVRAETNRMRGIAGLKSPMVGRDAELNALMQLSAAARAGVGRVAVVIGEPGLGKTRLTTEWRTADGGSDGNDETGLQWATGQCLSYGQTHAYHLLVSLLRSLLGVSTAANEAELHRSLLHCTGQLFSDSAIEILPYLGHLLSLPMEEITLEQLRRLEPQVLQRQYLMAMRRLLQAMASRRPLALILEDIHWADPSSTELLIKLTPLASESPLLFCFVTRPDHEAVGWKLVTAAGETVGAPLTEITLKELPESDSQRLVFNLLDIQSLPERTQSLILKKAEGNPFFVEEVIRMLIDHGALVKSGDQWIVSPEVVEVEIPDNLQGLLLARIDRLPDEAKRLLRIASVIGRRFSVRVLEQVMEEGPMKLISQLNITESSGLIRLLHVQPELEYLFRHALTQDAAYHSLLKQDRKHLHLAVAESLESLYSEQTNELAATLADHFERAELRDKAVHYLRQAGDRARAAFANQEALDFYQRAIVQIEMLQQLGGSQVDKWKEADVSLHESVADLLELSGNHEAALAGYDHVMTLLTPETKIIRARLHRKSANVLVLLQNLEGARRLYDEAETALGDAEIERLVGDWSEWISIHLDRAWLLYLTNEIDELTALAEKMRPTVERYGTAPQQSRFFSSLAQAGYRRDRMVMSDETLALAIAAFKAWQESGSAVETGRAVFGVGFCHLWRGEYDEAERMLIYGLSLAEKIGDIVTQTFYVTYMTVLYRKLGKLDKVKQFAARSLDLAERTQMKQYLGMTTANLAWIAWREGRLDEVQRYARETMDYWSKVKVHFPLQWAVQWPLLAIATVERRICNAADCARKMLSPDEQPLPDELTAALEQAIEAFEQNQMDQAQTQFEEGMRLAKQKGYL